MCGIGGVIRADGRRILKRWIEAIDERIAPRGPDGEGRYRDRVKADARRGRRGTEVALVHRRLSIIDLDGGRQPMVSTNGRDGEGLVAVVFNGCIYNHRVLRRELETRGHRFATDHSDTEVLLHGHREWGAELAPRLVGMYAYAIWDQDAATLSLARDRFGKKPMYVATAPHPQGGVRAAIFASDPLVVGTLAGELEQAGRGADEPDDDDEGAQGWLRDYLQLGYLPGCGLSMAPHGTVRELPPGGALRLHGHRTKGAEEGGEADSTIGAPPAGNPDGDVEGLLEQAVRVRLEADVPLGCFLSGGVDSSLVAAFAVRHMPDVRTFSVRMPDPAYDESSHAQRVAAHLGTDHTTLEVAMEPAEDLELLVSRLGQPFGDSSILPTYWVSRAAREHVKVALSGDGGDELFVGYDRYLAARWLHRGWKLLRALPVDGLRRHHPRSLRHRVWRLADAARQYGRVGLLSTESLFSPSQIDELLGRPAKLRGLWETDGDPIEALRRHDLETYLPFDLLRKVDVASMAVALEVRCPFLDRDLAALAMAMPIDELMAGGQRKGLLRQIARRHLPPEVVDRRKMGFAIPVGHWFRADVGSMRTLLLDHLRSREPFGAVQLSRNAVKRLIDEHLSHRCDHGQRLFALLTLSMWAKGV